MMCIGLCLLQCLQNCYTKRSLQWVLLGEDLSTWSKGRSWGGRWVSCSKLPRLSKPMPSAWEMQSTQCLQCNPDRVIPSVKHHLPMLNRPLPWIRSQSRHHKYRRHPPPPLQDPPALYRPPPPHFGGIWGRGRLRADYPSCLSPSHSFWRSSDQLVALAAHGLREGLVRRLSARSVSSVAWAYARAHVRHDALLEGLAARAAEPAVLAAFAPQGLVNVAWAYATLGVRDEALLRALATRVGAMRFRPQGIANFVWACAKLGWWDAAALEALAEQAHTVLRGFNAQDVASTAWAYATLGVRSTALMQALAGQAVRPAVLSSFKVQELAMVLWAFASLEVCGRPSSWYRTVASTAMQPTISARHPHQPSPPAPQGWI